MRKYTIAIIVSIVVYLTTVTVGWAYYNRDIVQQPPHRHHIASQEIPKLVPAPVTPHIDVPPAFFSGDWQYGVYANNGKIVHGWWVPVRATAYSPLDRMTRDDENNPNRLTSRRLSTYKHPYGIAIDPRRIPYMSKVIVPLNNGYFDTVSDRVFKADDTGPIIVNRTRRTGIIHIDLRFPSPLDARRYNKKQGHKDFCVFIIDETKALLDYSSK